MIETAGEVVESEGFELNPAKTRVMKHHARQLVAGAIVNNASPTAPREKRRRVRAIVHNCKKNGLVREARRYERGIQDEYGRPQVEPGRQPGEVKRSDRTWPYEKQAPFVPDRYNDPLVAYPREDWPWVYDFWHYLSGLVGEINALDPALGKRLQKEMEELKLGHTGLPEADEDTGLDEQQEGIRQFWKRAGELIADINREARPSVGNPKFFDYTPPHPDMRIWVARSEMELGAFAVGVYKQLFDSVRDKRALVRLWKEQGMLDDLRFAVELRHDTAHDLDPAGDREQNRERILRAGYERLFGEGHPSAADEWMAVQRNLCNGLLDDLKELRDWIAAEGLK